MGTTILPLLMVRVEPEVGTLRFLILAEPSHVTVPAVLFIVVFEVAVPPEATIDWATVDVLRSTVAVPPPESLPIE